MTLQTFLFCRLKRLWTFFLFIPLLTFEAVFALELEDYKTLHWNDVRNVLPWSFFQNKHELFNIYDQNFNLQSNMKVRIEIFHSVDKRESQLQVQVCFVVLLCHFLWGRWVIILQGAFFLGVWVLIFTVMLWIIQ